MIILFIITNCMYVSCYFATDAVSPSKSVTPIYCHLSNTANSLHHNWSVNEDSDTDVAFS